MGLFTKVEDILGKPMERFHRRRDFHPVDLSRFALRCMEQGCRRGIRQTYAPNLFIFYLHKSDYVDLLPFARYIKNDVAADLQKEVEERKLVLAGRLDVHLVESGHVEEGLPEIRGLVRTDEQLDSEPLPPFEQRVEQHVDQRSEQRTDERTEQRAEQSVEQQADVRGARKATQRAEVRAGRKMDNGVPGFRSAMGGDGPEVGSFDGEPAAGFRPLEDGRTIVFDDDELREVRLDEESAVTGEIAEQPEVAADIIDVDEPMPSGDLAVYDAAQAMNAPPIMRLETNIPGLRLILTRNGMVVENPHKYPFITVDGEVAERSLLNGRSELCIDSFRVRLELP